MRNVVLIAMLCAALAGCTGGSDAVVSQSDEQKFKHPAPIDPNMPVPDTGNRAGPRFVGEPSGASNPNGSAPPPEAFHKGR